MSDNQGVPASPSGCQASPSAANASSRSGIPNACGIPPDGWWCSREAGHEGPCAAREAIPPWYAKLIAKLRAPPYWVAEYGPDDARLDIAPRHASDALAIAIESLQAVRRVALACEGASYDLILSYADNALRARSSDGFWLSAQAIEARRAIDGEADVVGDESAVPERDAPNPSNGQ
jgi:hypothetical protein